MRAPNAARSRNLKASHLRSVLRGSVSALTAQHEDAIVLPGASQRGGADELRAAFEAPQRNATHAAPRTPYDIRSAKRHPDGLRESTLTSSGCWCQIWTGDCLFPSATPRWMRSCYTPLLDVINLRSPSFGAASMSKQKSSVEIHITDGAGGMRPVSDLRFETAEWPIELVVPAKDADIWMAHLGAGVQERGWSSSGLSQIDAVENSGTLSVHAANRTSPPTLHIVWEKPRDAALRVKARRAGIQRCHLMQPKSSSTP
jgi:hypothetical protein